MDGKYYIMYVGVSSEILAKGNDDEEGYFHGIMSFFFFFFSMYDTFCHLLVYAFPFFLSFSEFCVVILIRFFIENIYLVFASRECSSS